VCLAQVRKRPSSKLFGACEEVGMRPANWKTCLGKQSTKTARPAFLEARPTSPKSEANMNTTRNTLPAITRRKSVKLLNDAVTDLFAWILEAQLGGN
jgi:hypothetical protein